MKEQKTVCAESIWEFSNKLDNYFNQGWTIVPGTVIGSIAMSHSGPESYQTTKEEKAFFAVIEK